MLPTNQLPRLVRVTTIPIGLSLALTACIGSGDGGDDAGKGGGTGSVNSNAKLGRQDAVIAREGMVGGRSITNTRASKHRVEVMSVQRGGQYTRLRIAVNLTGKDSAADLGRFGGFVLLDPVGRKAYRALRFYELSARELWFTKGVRYETDIWFPALPQQVQRVTVLTPWATGEMPGVAVTNGPAAPPPGAPRPGPTVTGTAEPRQGQTVVYETDPPAPGTQGVVRDVYDQVEGQDGTSTTGAGTQTEELKADVLFAFNSDRLSAKAKGILDRVAREMAQRADTSQPVTIEGHTDGKGTAGYNQPLSERRAQAVRAAIAPRLGQVRFAVTGKGSQEPVAEETKDGKDDPAARARNRRVEINYSLKAGAPASASGSVAGGGQAGPPARFRSAPGEVVAERSGTGKNSTGEPVPFKLRVFPFYRDGAFLVAVTELTSLAADVEPANFGNLGYFGNSHVDGFTITAGSLAYLPVRGTPDEGEELGPYYGADNMYWQPKEPYRSYLYLTAPPAGTRTVTLNAGPFGKIQNVPVLDG